MERSGIITLLTDFGAIDPYVAMMKGVILSVNPDARPVDISHRVRAGSILQASGMLHETFLFFPKGTVHVAVVDPGVGSDRRLIVVEAEGHFFVGPDNGIFWPVIKDNEDAKIIHLSETKYFLPHVTHTFHGRDVFAPVAAHLSLGEDPANMGNPIKDPVKIICPMPRRVDNILYGQVMGIDNFGNIITNIDQENLELFLEKSKPIVNIGNLGLKEIHDIYSDVDRGEPLALINSSDLLEIAVNLGRASEYVGINANDIIGTVVKVLKYE